MIETPRLSLQQPSASTDNPASWPAQVGASFTTLDNAAMYQSGTLVSRPSAPVTGTIYYASDTGAWSIYNGSAWEALSVTSPWTTLTLPSQFVGQLRVRIEGDVVRFSGAPTNTGSTWSPATLTTLPSSCISTYASAVDIAVPTVIAGTSTNGLQNFQITHTGTMVAYNQSVANEEQLFFTGVTYELT